MAKVTVKVGIIGGSGLDNPEILDERREKFVDTPYGKPSDALIFGKIKGVDCILLARHGRKHSLMPSSINYCANIWALQNEGCTHILVTTACGSLKEEVEPGHIVFPNQFIDRTTKRNSTFYDGEHFSLMGVCHMPMHEPFCEMTRKLLKESAKELEITSHSTATVVTIEGPRFSSRAESKMFQSWGGDIINMTSVPEVCLAKEAAVCYAAIAMVTDYDCWKDDGKEVNVANVMEIFSKTVSLTLKLLVHVIPKIAEVDWTEEINKLKGVVKQSNMMSYMH